MPTEMASVRQSATDASRRPEIVFQESKTPVGAKLRRIVAAYLRSLARSVDWRLRETRSERSDRAVSAILQRRIDRGPMIVNIEHSADAVECVTYRNFLP